MRWLRRPCLLAMLLVLWAASASSAPFEIGEHNAWGPGEAAPIEGGELQTSALLRVGDFTGTLLVEWRLASDGRTCDGLKILEVVAGAELPLACTFPPAPAGSPQLSRPDDAVLLTVSDGGALVESARAAFQWEIVGKREDGRPGRDDPRDLQDQDPPEAAGTRPGGRRDRDRIESAAVALAPRARVAQGETVIVQVVVSTASGVPGSRTLRLEGRGHKLIETQSFESPGGETLTRSFVVGTSALGEGRHRFRLVLTDPNGRRDRELVRMRVAAAAKSLPEMPQSPLPDAICLDGLVTLSLYHDGSDGGDLIEIAIGGEILGGLYDLMTCGIDEVDPCLDIAEFTLRPGERTSVAIRVVEEGGGSPDASALELFGQCDPELQFWPMSGGESASFWVARPLGAGEIEAPYPENGVGPPAAPGS